MLKQTSIIIAEERRIESRKKRIETEIGCPRCGVWLELSNVHSNQNFKIEQYKTSDNKILTDFFLNCPYCRQETNFAWSVGDE